MKKRFFPLQLVVLVGAILTISAGCAIVDGVESLDVDLPYVLLQSSCGPTDGPAFELVFDSEQLSCDRYPSNPALSLMVIGTREPADDTTYTLGTAVDPGSRYDTGGWGLHCVEGSSECVTVEVGHILFRTDDQDTREVEIDLLFEDGTRLEDRFVVRECGNPALCG